MNERSTGLLRLTAFVQMLSGGVVRSSLSLVGQLSQVESLGGRVDLYGTGECFVEPSWLRLLFFLFCL